MPCWCSRFQPSELAKMATSPRWVIAWVHPSSVHSPEEVAIKARSERFAEIDDHERGLAMVFCGDGVLTGRQRAIEASVASTTVAQLRHTRLPECP